jgi:AcrR family transcriptional regulator
VSDAAPEQPARGRRRDFERNREAILRAASECTSELGLKTPIEVIARRAGLSPATIYRHFPSREDLDKAILDARLDDYAIVIEQAQESDDERLTFRQTIHAIVSMQSRDRSFRNLIAGDADRLVESPALSRFVEALFGSLDRAHRKGVLRDDVQNEDVLLLLIATEGVARTASVHSDDALRRLVDIVLDGICAERSELTGSAMSWSQLFDATRA